MTKETYYLALGILTLLSEKVDYAITQLNEMKNREEVEKNEGCDL